MPFQNTLVLLPFNSNTTGATSGVGIHALPEHLRSPPF